VVSFVRNGQLSLTKKKESIKKWGMVQNIVNKKLIIPKSGKKQGKSTVFVGA